ncbi:PadR family transcriptional regulator [Tsukamurella asaccharolytica]|uniref:PadR family transcriptional regulator n=1 Tax=Tsukamurella asaccharolytica TaxID=2592067 RepID=UPI0013153781|nr:PadR family transcriptional regulator [Tsukamurella asaccharolytica]
MALEHALLVSLSERSGTGYQLTRRFDRSIGHWWRASHQQIYKTLARMTENGLVVYVEQAQDGKPDKKVYSITDSGRKVLSEWIRTPGKDAMDRRELATKIRGAAPSDLPDLIAEIRRVRELHAERADLFRSLEARDYPAPATLTGTALQQHLVLRGGVYSEQSTVAWLDEVLTALAP